MSKTPPPTDAGTTTTDKLAQPFTANAPSLSSTEQHLASPIFKMEDEENPKTNQIPDRTLQKKHQLMLERLSTRHQTRLETRKIDSADSLTSTFLSRFNESKSSIISLLETTTDSSRLADISSAISALEKLVAENSYSLPSYEVRSSLKTISDLKQNLDNLSAQLIPRNKFSFKNKPTKTLTQIPKDDVVSVPKETKSIPNFPVRESPGFRNKQNEILFKNFNGSEIGEFTLSGLDSCEVRLVGCVNALFVNRLKGCKVYAGPVTGSILIEEVEDCVLVLASHQIRIHFAKSCDFYLRARSRPIIEDCDGVRFGPYCLKYEGIEEDLKTAGLNEETGNWSNVDDFKWLRAVQSPNWSVLPEEQRLETIDLVDLGCGDAAS